MSDDGNLRATGRKHALWDLAKKADESIRHRATRIEASEAIGAMSRGERIYLESYIETLADLASMIRALPGYRPHE